MRHVRGLKLKLPVKWNQRSDDEWPRSRLMNWWEAGEQTGRGDELIAIRSGERRPGQHTHPHTRNNRERRILEPWKHRETLSGTIIKLHYSIYSAVIRFLSQIQRIWIKFWHNSLKWSQNKFFFVWMFSHSVVVLVFVVITLPRQSECESHVVEILIHLLPVTPLVATCLLPLLLKRFTAASFTGYVQP